MNPADDFGARLAARRAARPVVKLPVSLVAAAPAMPSDVPAEWLDGVARLNEDDAPALISAGRWRTFCLDCRKLIALGYAAQASALGWSAVAVFGVHRHKPVERLDHAGLAWLLHSDSLMAISGESASLRTHSGAALTIARRADLPETALAWELAGEDRGETIPGFDHKDAPHVAR